MRRDTRPNFFVIGAARSGTTALAEMLRQHPDVFLTQPKEPHFLAFAGREVAFTGPGDNTTTNRAAITDAGEYASLYRSAAGSSVRGDASVTSLYYAEQSLETIRRHFPDARVVAILREPAARAYSAYSYLRVRGFEPHREFLDALTQEPERIKLGWQHLWHYTEMGRYARQLEPFLADLGSERIKILFYEDLCRDPLGTVRGVFDFLAVDPDVRVSSERVNVSGRPRSAAVQATIHWATRRPRVRSSIKRMTPFRMRERIRRANLGREDLPARARSMLEETFADEVDSLKGLLERHYPGIIESAPAWIASPEAMALGR
jgi:LPS sulfotransferase NodH